MERILYGKPIAEELDAKSKLIFTKFENGNDRKPKLTAITVGDNPASLLYVSRKEEKAIELGVEFNWIKLNKETSQKDLEEKVELSAKDSDGIIIQLPLPEHINPEEAINKIPYNLDVDGLTALNLGNLYSEEYKIIPATSLAILETSGKFIISIPGLPISSPNIHLVFGLIAFLKPSISLGLTNVVSIPNLGRVNLNKLKLPPYSWEDATMWSPALQIVRRDSIIALIPEAVARVAEPPSKAATLSSRTATVGFEILL